MGTLVPERPFLPIPSFGGPSRAVSSWAANLVKALIGTLTQISQRVNRSYQKDGTEAMTAPATLAEFTDAPDTKPPASGWEGGIIYVSDGASRQKFRGSDGSSWVNLG